MPKKLPLTAADKRKILKRYAKGETPAEIANAFHALGLTGSQIATLVHRSGISRHKGEIREIREKTAQQVLQSLRESSLADFKETIGSIAEGLKIDAGELKDGWGMVEGAADASSLQRAKNLHLSRLLKLYGAENEPEQQPTVSILFQGGPIGPAPRFAKTVTPDAEKLNDSDGQDLEFAEDGN